ncbi:MAG: cysteine--tRNA ligase [Chloroflexi bacterium]|nr:cysteine--tRNA ligase [Chloroflexota bacterium]
MKVTSTLFGQKEEFLPPGSEVKMYVCGVTPYDESHIGHAMSYIIFDAIRRYLTYRGYRVRYVQNVTDIDDKIIDRAARLKIPASELAKKYTDSFFADMEKLNILKADVYPRATEEIPKIIEVIKGLVDKGFAYPASSGVYFRVRSDPDYGKLSHRTLDSMVAGARIEPGEEKEHPMDFALWKAAKPGEPSWPSPWGTGRPGWHIECSAMSLRYLGETIDIHGGGQDLIFPHHENEMAQSEGFTGKKPFVRYWLHNGLLQLGEQKMSKSLGNLITIKDALAKFSADALRIFILSSHYRSPLTYSEEALEAAERGAERLRTALHSEDTGDKASNINAETYRQRFTEAMDDDFNSSQALAVLFDLARDINRLRDEGNSTETGKQLLVELAGVLGLTLKSREDTFTDAAPFIELLIYIRKQLREAKQYQLADMVRNKLAELDIALEDTPKGTSWKRKR